ncbi:MAG: hypothetical protein GY854_02620 [Deltaproteobacteria bacterium]|nr:hypothetical protein [Deltaproteobacteria bacterium]
MLITNDNLDEIIKQHKRMIGFWGAPPWEILQEASERLGLGLLDLDVFYDAAPSKILPDAYCHIIRNCVDNAVALGPGLECIIAAIGKEKCEAGRFAARIIHEVVGVDVIETENKGISKPRPPHLCEARGRLKKRIVQIMQGIGEPLGIEAVTNAKARKCQPTHGFWGTPPHPIELLNLFPETTHIFGWTRCVEQGRPADLELEMFVPSGLPIVFFSQGFCPKAQLARHLAEKHNGMHVDAHDSLGAATRAKIEAFIRLSVPGGI